eukprot:GHVU01113987.1.p1 GENE.GHVU01113987.1~~GHVU01113987.1.p1  ORF type:complete len:147 (+),score=3.42 GHVU01113987.1:32-442(+)
MTDDGAKTKWYSLSTPTESKPTPEQFATVSNQASSYDMAFVCMELSASRCVVLCDSAGSVSDNRDRYGVWTRKIVAASERDTIQETTTVQPYLFMTTDPHADPLSTMKGGITSQTLAMYHRAHREQNVPHACSYRT